MAMHSDNVIVIRGPQAPLPPQPLLKIHALNIYTSYSARKLCLLLCYVRLSLNTRAPSLVGTVLGHFPS